MLTSLRQLAFGTFLISLTLTLIACGSGSSSDPEPEPEPPEPPRTTPKAFNFDTLEEAKPHATLTSSSINIKGIAWPRHHARNDFYLNFRCLNRRSLIRRWTFIFGDLYSRQHVKIYP